MSDKAKQCLQCDNEVSGKATYCSPKCRKAASRASVTDTTPVSVTNEGVTSTVTHYVDRTNPNTLNTGDYMSSQELEQAGLKANRVPIPGDHDYEGVCEQVDGKWQVKQGGGAWG